MNIQILIFRQRLKRNPFLNVLLCFRKRTVHFGRFDNIKFKVFLVSLEWTAVYFCNANFPNGDKLTPFQYRPIPSNTVEIYNKKFCIQVAHRLEFSFHDIDFLLIKCCYKNSVQ